MSRCFGRQMGGGGARIVPQKCDSRIKRLRLLTIRRAVFAAVNNDIKGKCE